MSGASIEETLELWAASLREVEARMAGAPVPPDAGFATTPAWAGNDPSRQ